MLGKVLYAAKAEDATGAETVGRTSTLRTSSSSMLGILASPSATTVGVEDSNRAAAAASSSSSASKASSSLTRVGSSLLVKASNTRANKLYWSIFLVKNGLEIKRSFLVMLVWRFFARN